MQIDSTYVFSEARSAADFAAARALFEEYAAQLKIDLCFQGFSRELQTLEELYAPPVGCLVLAWRGGASVACGAIRRFAPQACEMKRLYVRRGARGANVGRRIAERLIARAQTLGYERMLLDTLADMIPAQTLYRSLGFRVTSAYYPSPLPSAVYMELDLRARALGGITAEGDSS